MKNWTSRRTKEVASGSSSWSASPCRAHRSRTSPHVACSRKQTKLESRAECAGERNGLEGKLPSSSAQGPRHAQQCSLRSAGTLGPRLPNCTSQAAGNLQLPPLPAAPGSPAVWEAAPPASAALPLFQGTWPAGPPRSPGPLQPPAIAARQPHRPRRQAPAVQHPQTQRGAPRGRRC